MPVGRLQRITAIVMAYAVMLILVSPVVPSPLTMVRSKHSIQPPHLFAPVAALFLSSADDLLLASVWITVKHARIASDGPEIIDLTTARLC